jgi:hypothetical protein
MAVTAFFFCAGFLRAQKISAEQIANPSAAMAAKIAASIAVLQLDTLHGTIPALYSDRYKVRAATIQSLVEKCAAFYRTEFPDVAFDLRIMVLDSLDWRRIHLEEYGSPYGMPTAWSEISKLFISADKQAVGRLFGESDNLPDTVLSQFDCIALHELGHIFMEKFNHTNTGKKWSDEFLASYFAICFFEENKNYPGLPQVGESGYQPEHKTLEDFEKLYSNVGARNYGWYQGQFQNLGYALYPKFKTDLLRKFIESDSADEKKPDPLTLLQQLAPAITSQWLKGMK